MSVLAFIYAIGVFPGPAFAAEKPEIFVQTGHASFVKSIAFSTDGRYALSGGFDAVLKRWDLRSGRELRTYRGHEDYVHAVALSPDGRQAASAGNDDRIILWDLETGQALRTFKDGIAVTAVAFLASGGLVSGNFSGDVKLWNVQTDVPRELRSARRNAAYRQILALRELPGGRQLLVGSKAGFVVIDVGSDTPVRAFGERREGDIQCVAFSSDGALALSAIGAQVTLWDVRTGQAVRGDRGHGGKVESLSFSPDGRHFVTAGNGVLKLWETESGREVGSLSYFGLALAAFAPDGRHVLTGSGASYGDGTIKVWDLSRRGVPVGKVHSGSPAMRAGLAAGDWVIEAGGQAVDSWEAWVAIIQAHPERELSVTVERVGQILTLKAIPAAVRRKDDQGRERTVGVIGVDLGKTPWVRSLGEPLAITAMALWPDGRQVTTGRRKGWMQTWDLVTGRRIGLLRQDTEDVAALAVSPQGGRFLTGAGDRVLLWEATKSAPLKDFEQPGRSKGWGSDVNALAWSADGRRALSVGQGSLLLLDMEGMKPLATLPLGHQFNSDAVAFSPDGRHGFSGDTKGDVQVWELAAARRVRILDHGPSVHGIALSPDGRRLVSGGWLHSVFGEYRDTLKIWDWEAGRLLHAFGNYKKSVNAVRFSADGRHILTGGDELLLWETQTGRVVHRFEGHVDKVRAVAFLPDGRRILSAGRDGTVRLWDLATGRELAQLVSFDDGEWIAATPEGYYEASPGGDRRLNVRAGGAVYGIENYREAFFRPDLVRIALGGGSLAGFRTLAQVALPPVVEIVAPPAGVAADRVTIQLRLKDKGGGIGDIRLYLNGSAVAMEGRAVAIVPVADREITRSFELPLVQGRNVITAVAFNGDNTMQSNEATVVVTAAFAAAGKPSLYALVIGINEFANPKLKLNYAAADAALFAATLQDASAGLFDKVHIRKLTAMEATTNAAIIREIQSFQSLRPDDIFVFYIASHGTVDEGEYFLITSNVGSLRTEKLKTDAISQHMLKKAIMHIPATKKLILIDTCNAGALGEAIQAAMLTRGMSEDTALKILSRSVGSTILSASTSFQEALEGYRGHGLFTYVLSEGLKGKADKGKTGYVKTTELADYVDSEVPLLAEKVFKRAQYPTISISGQAFPIGRVK
jgi:WD40 repeat protein